MPWSRQQKERPKQYGTFATMNTRRWEREAFYVNDKPKRERAIMTDDEVARNALHSAQRIVCKVIVERNLESH